MDNQCCHRVYRGHFLSGQCLNGGIVEVNGKWFCKIHSPEGKKNREEKNQARWKAENEALKAKWDKEAEDKRRAQLFPELVDALQELIFASTGLVEEKYLRDAHAVLTKAEGK